MDRGLLSGRRTLVVEDEFLIALDIQRLLEDAGASEALVATTLAEANAILADGSPIHLAVVDLRLGSEDAGPLVSDLKQRGIPILITSGLSPGDMEVAGAVAILPKPYSDEEFTLTLKTLLGARQEC